MREYMRNLRARRRLLDPKTYQAVFDGASPTSDTVLCDEFGEPGFPSGYRLVEIKKSNE